MAAAGVKIGSPLVPLSSSETEWAGNEESQLEFTRYEGRSLLYLISGSLAALGVLGSISSLVLPS